MIPREAGRGRSFSGAGKYYLHDKGALTAERVAFTHTENIPTQDPDKALKWMAWTAINAKELKRQSGSKMTGRHCVKPVFTFSLSWHPEDRPSSDDMIQSGKQALVLLGLHEHEAIMVAHNDRPHQHLHVIVSAIHPETGKASRVSFSKRKLSAWAQEYERAQNKIRCRKRVANNDLRSAKKGKHVKSEVDLRTTIKNLYHASDSGAAFQAALANEGLTLARGKRVVVIDGSGKSYSLSRQIDDASAKQIRAKLKDVALPAADDFGPVPRKKNFGKTRQTKAKAKAKPQGFERKRLPSYFDRDQQDRAWQQSIIDAAIQAEENRPANNRKAPLSPNPSPQALNRLQDGQLGELGRLGTDNTLARLKLAEQLDVQYGSHERQLRQDIGQLESLVNNSGKIKLWWLKLQGTIPADPAESLKNMNLTLGNIELRKAEARQALEANIRKERQAMEIRHNQERLKLHGQPTSPRRDSTPNATNHSLIDEDLNPSLG